MLIYGLINRREKRWTSEYPMHNGVSTRPECVFVIFCSEISKDDNTTSLLGGKKKKRMNKNLWLCDYGLPWVSKQERKPSDDNKTCLLPRHLCWLSTGKQLLCCQEIEYESQWHRSCLSPKGTFLGRRDEINLTCQSLLHQPIGVWA